MSDVATPTPDDAEKYYRDAAHKFEDWFGKMRNKLIDKGFRAEVESVDAAKPEMKLAYSNAFALKQFEVDQLKQRLEEAEKVIGFYADKDSWQDNDLFGYPPSIYGDSQSGREFGEHKHLTVGGKRAREYLKTNKKA